MFLLYLASFFFPNKVSHNSKLNLLITHVYIDVFPKVLPRLQIMRVSIRLLHHNSDGGNLRITCFKTNLLGCRVLQHSGAARFNGGQGEPLHWPPLTNYKLKKKKS